MSFGRTPLDDLRETLLSVAAGLSGSGGEGRAPEGVTLERPPKPEFGDYSTNAALLLAPRLGMPPREAAAQLGAELQALVGEEVERFEVAGPGFVNLFMSDRWLRGALTAMLQAGERYGTGGTERAEKILVEFVSANPTGPMHVGHARNAAYGDALARLLAMYGHEVTREFYVNDAGTQVAKLGESILALAAGRTVPEDGYKGDYVKELAERLAPSDAAALDARALGKAAVGLMVAHMRGSLEVFGVGSFDHWQLESELHEGSPSRVEHALALLEEHGHTYRSEGALWLRTTVYGDDKDRVLVRSNGEHTYFASDIAYHQDKRERGYERQIDVWGADHHGYVARMKAAYEALGGEAEHLEMLIMQLVHLVRSGERAQMSKRAGEFVTLDDLVTEIGVDAARWYLLSRSHDTTIDLDLDLARAQSSENPVYYVQYAHARIASMLTKAGIARVAAALEEEHAVQEPLHSSERALIKRLLELPGEVDEAAKRRAPHRIAAYALQVAQDFTAFYRDCRVVGAEPAALERQRIALSVAARNTIACCLEDLLGVAAPREM
ncbi:MAG TPA: arginine--tRNA ligase [Solirubrobacteraceae bacterium]|jgi:arginyl-tRNA synthetase|nr:arginine--tRNA ligase [Solirubrobacteraceae bacterium]